MSKVLIFTFMSIASLAQAAKVPVSEISSKQKRPLQVRVLIENQVPKVRVRGLDLSFYQVKKKRWTSRHRQSLYSQWTLRCRNGKIQGRSLEGVKKNFRSPLRIKAPSGRLNVNVRPVENEIRIRAIRNRCSVVKSLPLDQYLVSELSTEKYKSWPNPALEAQLIALRSFALFKMMEARKKKAFFDFVEEDDLSEVRSVIHDQPRVARLAAKTRGRVLVAEKDGFPIKAFSHESCGGRTWLPEQIFNRRYTGLKKRIRCPFCRNKKELKWKTKLPEEIVQNTLAPRLFRSDADEYELRQIKVASRTTKDGPKMFKLMWEKDDNPHFVEATSNDLRRWLGESEILSSTFKIQKTGGEYRFSGKGHGHGVGLCQHGAREMAKKGFTSKRILSFYYPDAKVKQFLGR